MHSYLKDWAPGMKEAMLFLNHITELRFFVIEKSHTIITLSNYRTTVNQCAQVSRVQLHNALSAFKQDSCTQPTVVRYPITISTVTHKRGGAEQHVKENWLIQQGVGDIENEHQTWKYISNIKPRHGIAAPICEAINPGKCQSLEKYSVFSLCQWIQIYPCISMGTLSSIPIAETCGTQQIPVMKMTEQHGTEKSLKP